jgi:hypothetical protein
VHRTRSRHIFEPSGEDYFAHVQPSQAAGHPGRIAVSTPLFSTSVRRNDGFGRTSIASCEMRWNSVSELWHIAPETRSNTVNYGDTPMCIVVAAGP